MKKILPISVLESSAESLFIKNTLRSQIIYTTLLLVVISTFCLLPVISVDITVQSRGVVRTPSENNALLLPVYGKIEEMNIRENLFVNKGDTLLVVQSDKIDAQIAYDKQKIEENRRYMSDLQALLENKPVRTKLFRQLRLDYTQKLNNYATRLAQSKKEYQIAKRLYEDQVKPKNDYEKIASAYYLAETDFHSFKESQKQQWQLEKEKYRLDNQRLRMDLKQ